MNWAVRWMVGTVLVTGGFLFGNAVGSNNAPPAPPAKVVKVPHYIAGPTKTVTKNEIPQVCRDAIRAAGQMQQAASEYEKAVGTLPSIIDKTGVAMHNESIKELNEQRQRHIKLEADSIQALLDLREAQQNIGRLQPKCDAATR